jgi:uncharacterized protein (TIGR02271 family)
MRTETRDVAVGVFHDRDRARDAIEALKDAGFGGGDISVLMPDIGQTRAMAADTGTQAGAATGAVAGGVLGGLGGWLVGIGALAIPGVGPFIAAGAFATALAGAAIGAGVGAVAGALVGMGIPQEEAEWYEGEVRGGRTLVTVRADGRYDAAQTILRWYSAYNVQSRDAAGTRETSGYPAAGTPAEQWEDALPRYRSRWEQTYGSTGSQWDEYEPAYRYGWEMRRNPRYQGRAWSDVEPELQRDWETRHRDRPWNRVAAAVRELWEDTDAERTMRLREERLRPEKETVEAGDAVLRKEVVSEQQTLDVPVTREEVIVERHPVAGSRPASGTSREGEEIRVPVREEQVELEKQVVVTEEVSVGKRPVTETERVSGTVRREVARVETSGDVNVRGAAGAGATASD